LILFGVPSFDQLKYLNSTAPNIIFAMNYKQLDTALQIAAAGPIHAGIGREKLAATDLKRKWTRWNLPMNGAALMYREPGGDLETVLFGGNGKYPNT